MVRNFLESDSAGEYLKPMESYKESVLRLFPALNTRIVDNCSIFPTDAVILGVFLEHYPRKVAALEIGTFVGISTFCLAAHHNVSRVIGVDPNPIIAEELTANTDRWTGHEGLEALEKLRVFDVACTVLEEFDAEREKIELRPGVVGSTQVGAKGGTIPGLQRVDVPTVDSMGAEGLVALVDGLHTREGVTEDLKAIFGKNPYAVALLDDCRQGWGPLVQAGVVSFMEESAEKYEFRLLADLGPGLAKSSFGVLYHESAAAEMGEILDKIRKTFNQELDPVRLLKQKEGLQKNLQSLDQQLKQARKNEARFESSSSRLRARLAEARNRNGCLSDIVSRLKAKNESNKRRAHEAEESVENLKARYSRRRYKLVDSAANAILRIPGIESLLRRYG